VAIAYVFNPALSAEELLQRIVRELGVAAASGTQAALTDALNVHLLAERKAGRLSVVVIDEAQAVSIEVLEQLRLLSNLETNTEKLLRLVLVGQPQLAELLLDPALAQLNQRITLRWHLGPLTAEETAAYVRHRLSVASGGKVTDLFTRSALRLVHRLSRRVPRLVNMIAHRALVAAYVARRLRVSAGGACGAGRAARRARRARAAARRPRGAAERAGRPRRDPRRMAGVGIGRRRGGRAGPARADRLAARPRGRSPHGEPEHAPSARPPGAARAPGSGRHRGALR